MKVYGRILNRTVFKQVGIEDVGRPAIYRCIFIDDNNQLRVVHRQGTFNECYIVPLKWRFPTENDIDKHKELKRMYNEELSAQ